MHLYNGSLKTTWNKLIKIWRHNSECISEKLNRKFNNGYLHVIKPDASAMDPEKHKLVCWCFEPCQPQRIISGLNTNFTLSPSYSFHKSSYHKLCFFSLFIFCRHSTREPASSRVTYFILRVYTGTSVSHSQHMKKSRELLKKCRWMDRKGRNKQGRNPWQ